MSGKNPGSARKEDRRPAQCDPGRRVNPRSPTEPQTQKTSGFFNLPPPPYNPKSVGPALNHEPVPSVCLRGRQPGHPLATQPTSPLLTFPLSFSPPSNHLHPAASVIQTQIKPWSSLTESAPMTSQQASNNAQRPRTPQARTPGPLLQNPDFLLVPCRLPAHPYYLQAFAPGIPCPEVLCWLLSHLCL